MFERQIKSQLSSKAVKVITIVFVTLFVLSCVIALSGCSKGDNTIQNHEWKFDIVQGTANDGAVIACSKDSQWVSETAKIIELSIQIKEGSLTIVNESDQETFVLSYKEKDLSGESRIYDVEYNGTKGIASVSKTTYQDKTEIPTLIISINEYSLYFYEKWESKCQG